MRKVFKRSANIMPAVGLLILSACGFKPLYERPQSSEYAQSKPLLCKLEVKGNKDYGQATYLFKQQLQSLLAASEEVQKAFNKIEIKLSYSFQDIGYKTDASAVRKQGKVTANILAYDRNGNNVYKSELDSVTSFNLDETEEFSNIVGESAAEQRIVNHLAYSVMAQLFKFLRNNEHKNKS